jgi:DNA-binding SARP family transcriptional activator
MPPDADPGSISIAIFGGLRIWRGGHEIDAGPPRHRIVLATLLVALGSVVGIAELVDALWESEPPSSAVNQIHRIVGQVRRRLEPGLSRHAAGRYLLAAGAGYRIVAKEIGCDLYECNELVRRAQLAVANGDHQTAQQCYAAALQVSRDSVLPGLDHRTLLRPEILAIEQDRIATAVEVADFARQNGSARQAIGSVMRVADSAPLNEPLQARLISLLAFAGRGSEALKRYDAIRQMLADELGIAPGVELRAAYRDLLSDLEPPVTVAG